MRDRTILKITALLIIFTIITACIVFGRKYVKFPKGNEEAAVKLYDELIDKELSKGYDFDYISIEVNNLRDPLTGEKLSKNSQLCLLDCMKKYKKDVYSKSREELIIERLGTSEELDGILIKLTVNSHINNNAIVTCAIYKSNLGSGGNTYSLKYNRKKGLWQIGKLTGSFVS